MNGSFIHPAEGKIKFTEISTIGNKKRFYAVAALLLIAVVVAYSNHFQNAFHFDDSHTIVNNIYIRDLRNIPLFFKDSSTSSSLPANQAYRPVVTTTTAVDYWIGGGLKPFYFHLSTFILFIIQGILMYFLYLRIFNLSSKHERNQFVALLGTAWYLLHPANAETINYILARSDSISTMFVVLAFAFFLYSPFCRKWHLYLFPVMLGALTKPTAVMFGPLLFVYVLLFEEKTDLSQLFFKNTRVPLLNAFKRTSIALLFCVCMFAFVRIMDSDTWATGGASRFQYLITQPYVLLHYFTTFFLPLSLSADTDWIPLDTLLDRRFFVGILFVISLAYVALKTSKDEILRPVSFGILWFFISLIPTSTVIPLAEIMNDHRLFFPYVGLSMGICWTIYLIIEKFKLSFAPNKTYYRAIAAVILMVLALYAYGTYERNEVWKTEETLWRDVTEKSPKNGRGLMNYGLTLMAKADYAGAETYFTRALEFTPKYAYLHINLGILKAAMGASAEAEHYFRNAISLGPNYPECYFFYARFLKDQRRNDEAIGNLKKALELSPGHMEARYMLMSLYFEKDDRNLLQELAEETLRIFPNDKQSSQYLSTLVDGKSQFKPAKESVNSVNAAEDLLNLSLKYFKARQFRKSIEAASAALKLRPDYALAYNNICAAYNELKQWDKAIEAGEQAVKLAPDNQLARNNLLWAKRQKLSEKSASPQ